MAGAQTYDLFNPQVESPSQLLKPTEAIRYSETPAPNQSLGTLFSGVADIISSGTKAADQYFRTAIREEVEKPVDEITNMFTGRGPVPAGGGGDSTAPDEVVRTGERLTRLTQGLRAGTIQNSHYWGLLDMEARRLRAKYPGYRDHIDNVFQDMTGSVPANALRRSLVEEARHRAEDDPAKQLRHWEEIVITRTPFGPEVAARHAAGNPMTIQELQARASEHFSVQTNITARKNALELQSTTGQVNRHTAMNTASDAIWADIHSAFRGADFNRLMGMVQSANARTDEQGRPQLSTQEQAAITQEFTKFRQALNQTVRLRVTEYGRLGLHAEDATAIQRNIENTMKNLEDDINQGRTTLLAMYKSIAEGIGSADRVTLLSTNEQFRVVNALREIVGPNGMERVLRENPNLTRNVFQNNVLNLSKLFIQDTPDAPRPSLADVHRQNRDNGITAPEAYRATRQSMLNILQDQNTNPQAIERTADALYGPANSQYLDLFPRGTARDQVFREMSSPAVTKRMAELRDQGNTQAWNNYVRWVNTNSANLAHKPAQDMVLALADPNSRLTIVLNPETNQLELGPSAPPPGRGSASLPGGSDFFLASSSRYAGAARQWIEQLNTALLPLNALGDSMSAEGGGNQAVQELLRVHGLKVVPDPSNPGRSILRPLREGHSPTNPMRSGLEGVQGEGEQGRVDPAGPQPSQAELDFQMNLQEAEMQSLEAQGLNQSGMYTRQLARQTQDRLTAAISEYEKNPTPENLEAEIKLLDQYRALIDQISKDSGVRNPSTTLGRSQSPDRGEMMR